MELFFCLELSGVKLKKRKKIKGRFQNSMSSTSLVPLVWFFSGKVHCVKGMGVEEGRKTCSYQVRQLQTLAGYMDGCVTSCQASATPETMDEILENNRSNSA